MAIPTESVGSINRPPEPRVAIGTPAGTNPAPGRLEEEHVRPLPRLGNRPFRYNGQADNDVDVAPDYAHSRANQAIISSCCDKITTMRDAAFATIRARVAGTTLTAHILGGG